MVIRLGNKTPDEYNASILAWLITMPVFIDVLNVIVRQYSLGNQTIYTSMFYILTLAFIVVRPKISVRDLLILGLIYVFFLINYFLASDTRSYYTSSGMQTVYMFFIPFCVFSVRKIRVWDAFLRTLEFLAPISVMLGAFLLLFLDYRFYLVYMDFSYAMLPSICACYYFARTSNDNKTENNRRSVLYWLPTVIGLIEIVVFGARAPIIFTVMFIVFYELLRSDRRSSTKFVLLAVTLIAGGLLVQYSNNIFALLGNLSIFRNSRFITRFNANTLFDPSGRDYIGVWCRERISSMGLEISGLFGDRQYCRFEAYPHNIIYELLMQWGWIIGIAMIAYIAFLVIKILRLPTEKRAIGLILIFSIFARYFISGSYVQEGKFWIFIVASIAITRKEFQNKNEDVPLYETNCKM